MTSHHAYWQKQWTRGGSGDLIHESGLRVTITCRVLDTEALAKKHGPHNFPAKLARLLDEARALREADAAGVSWRRAWCRRPNPPSKTQPDFK